MTREEFISELKNIEPNQETAQRLNYVYQMVVPTEIVKILSFYDSPEFFDENESRTLYLKEVINAEEENDVPFKSAKLVPIVDLGDNDFIVYDGNKKIWCVYNIIDEILFSEGQSFEEVFLS